MAASKLLSLCSLTACLPPAAFYIAGNDQPIPSYPANYNVKDFGAVGDGKTGALLQLGPQLGCLAACPYAHCGHGFLHSCHAGSKLAVCTPACLSARLPDCRLQPGFPEGN